jgi:hypothetical protein
LKSENDELQSKLKQVGQEGREGGRKGGRETSFVDAASSDELPSFRGLPV